MGNGAPRRVRHQPRTVLILRLPPELLKSLAAQGRITLPPKQSKYRSQPVIVDGVRFDSKAEARRWATLQLLERAGVISSLKRQVSFPFELDGQVIFKWIADHVYDERGVTVIEDVKGFATKEYKLKKKLIEAMYKISILEVKP